MLKKKYHIGEKISFTKPGILKNKTYKIVGFVKSSEFLDKTQFGQTNIGNGRLSGFAVTTHNAFASPVYQVSRVTFKNTANLSPFSVTYRNRVNRVYHDQNKPQKALNKNRQDKYDKYVQLYKQQYQQLTKHLNQSGSTENIMMIAPKSATNFRKSINLRERQSKKKLALPNDGVIISEKLATLLNVKKGSTISIKNSAGKTYHFKVKGICEMYLGHYIFMNQTEYTRATGQKYTANAYLITMRNHQPQEVNRISQKLVKTAAIETVVSNSSNRKILGSYTGSLNEVIFILILISGMLAVVVIYNLTNINVAERIRELSTIKVLGFYDNKATMYIYRETIILSALGIIVGFGFGWWLHHFIINSLPPDAAMFDPNMYPLNFVFSALIPAIITAALAIVVHHKIKKINMLDALSSIV